MSNQEEQYVRLKSYKQLFINNTNKMIDQYNEQSIELFKNNISSVIKNIQKEYKEKEIKNISGSGSGSDSGSDSDDLTFVDFLNKKMSCEIDKMVSKQNYKYEREVKNTLDSELTTFLNKTLFMIFDIKRKQEQSTEMMISNLINQSPFMNKEDDDDDADDDDETNSGNEEESSIKRFLERFNLNTSDNEDIENLDEINTNCINSDIEDADSEEEEDEEEEVEEEEPEEEEPEEEEPEEEENNMEKEQKEYLNTKTLIDLKAIAKTLEITLKYGGKHKSKLTLVNEIYEKEKEELKKLNKQND